MALPPIGYDNIRRSTHIDSNFPGVLYVDASQHSYVVRCNPYKNKVSNPGWRNQVAKGQSASTAYSVNGLVLVPAYVFCETHADTRSGYTFAVSDGECAPSLNNNVDASLKDLALTRLKRKLQSETGAMNAVVPVVELREFRSMIGGLAHLATGAVKTLIDIKRTKGRSAAKYAADAWLTWSFGVKPMIKDAKDAAESLAKYIHRKDHSVRLTGSAQKIWHESKKANSIPGGFGCHMEGYMHSVHTLSYRYVAGFQLNLKSANDYGVMPHFGLEFGSIIPTMWELLPYSWLVDYFTTAGSYLDDTFTSSGGTTSWCIQNRRYIVESETDVMFVKDSPAIITRNETDTSTQRYFEFERIVLSALPRSALRFKSADEVAGNAVNKLLNLCSIIAPGKRRSDTRYSLGD
jgi:hypothetical protein